MSNPFFDIFMIAFAALEKHSRLLGGDYVLCPSSDDFGYQSTPKNSLTFSQMGVDGVHCAILKREGKVREDSPVVQVSPMDSDDVTVLAPSFLEYLADGCAVSLNEMRAVFEAERAIKGSLVIFLSAHFDDSRLFDEGRMAKLTADFGHLIERKTIS